MITLKIEELSRLKIIRDILDEFCEIEFGPAFTKEFIDDCGEDTLVSIDDQKFKEKLISIEDVSLIFAVDVTFFFPNEDVEAFVKLKWF